MYAIPLKTLWEALHKILVLIILLKADNITSVNITGGTEVNATYGSNVNITWKIKSQAQKRLLLEIYVNNTNIENRLFFIFQTNIAISGDFGKGQSIKDVAQRSSAFYYARGMVEGEVVLTIRNLRLDDSNEYILRDSDSTDQKNLNKTILSVNSPPVLSGKNLSERYTAKSEDFTLKLTFLGNPRPEVTWTLDGLSIPTTVMKNSFYNYTYTVTIKADSLPTPCSSKQLNCTATGYGGSINGFTTIYGGCSDSSGVAIGAGIGGAVVALFIVLVLVIYRMKRKIPATLELLTSKTTASAVPVGDVAGNRINNAAQETEGNYGRVHQPNTRQQPSGFRPQRVKSNDYVQVDRIPKPQGAAAAAAPEDSVPLYAAVNTNQDPPREQPIIYSELGPGGGRVGPKLSLQPSHYAEA